MRLETIVASAPTPASRPLQTRRLVRSLLIAGVDSTRDSGTTGRGLLQPPAYGLHYQRLRPLKLLVRSWQISEDPAGQELLDRTVEAHRGEVGGDVLLERAVGARGLHDRRDHRVGLADLLEVLAAERVRGARDLDDDHLHQVGLVVVRVDDERGDHV